MLSPSHTLKSWSFFFPRYANEKKGKQLSAFQLLTQQGSHTIESRAFTWKASEVVVETEVSE
jgi:hypothetical protein